jgi:hypothetical protein
MDGCISFDVQPASGLKIICCYIFPELHSGLLTFKPFRLGQLLAQLIADGPSKRCASFPKFLMIQIL